MAVDADSRPAADYQLTRLVLNALRQQRATESVEFLAGVSLLDRVATVSAPTAVELTEALRDGRASLLPCYVVAHPLLGGKESALRNLLIGLRSLHTDATALKSAGSGSELGALANPGRDGRLRAEVVEDTPSRHNMEAAHHRGAVNVDLIGAVQVLGTLLGGPLDLLLVLNRIAGEDNPLAADAAQQLWKTLLISADNLLNRDDPLSLLETQAALSGGQQLAYTLVDELVTLLGSHLRHQGPRGSQPLLILNPSPSPRREMVEIAAGENPDMEIIDEAGEALPYDILGEGDRDPLLRIVTDLPACGYRLLSLRPRRGPAPEAEISAANEIENEFVHLIVDRQEGTLTLIDKLRQVRYDGTHHFVDGGDLGDQWQYVPPASDVQIGFPTNAPLEVVRYSSPAEVALNYLLIYRLPAGIDPQTQNRQALTAQFAPMAIDVTVRLLPGTPRVDFQVRVRDQSKGHRLQVRFPMAEVSGCWVDGPEGFQEFSGATLEQRCTLLHESFTTVCGPEAGLTLSSRSSRSVEFSGDTPLKCLALTLLREPQGGGDEGSTPLQELRFDYSLSLHGPERAEGWQAGLSQRAPVIAALTPRGRERLPNSLTLVQSEQPEFLIQGVKAADDGSRALIVHAINAGTQAGEFSLFSGLPLQSARVVTLLENDDADAKALRIIDPQRLSLELKPGELVTLRLDPA